MGTFLLNKLFFNYMILFFKTKIIFKWTWKNWKLLMRIAIYSINLIYLVCTEFLTHLRQGHIQTNFKTGFLPKPLEINFFSNVPNANFQFTQRKFLIYSNTWALDYKQSRPDTIWQGFEQGLVSWECKTRHVRNKTRGL